MDQGLLRMLMEHLASVMLRDAVVEGYAPTKDPKILHEKWVGVCENIPSDDFYNNNNNSESLYG